MKLPTYTPQVEVPSRFPQPEVPTGSPVGQALTTAGGQIEEVGLRAETLLAHAAQQQKNAQQALDAGNALTQFTDQLQEFTIGLKQGVRDPGDPTTFLPGQEPATPENYVPRWQAGTQQIQQQVLQGITDPDTRLAAAKLIGTQVRERQYQARTYAADLFANTFQAGLEETLGNVGRAAANAPTPEISQMYEGVAQGLIKGAQGTLEPTKVLDITRKYQNDTDTARVLIDARVDPELTQERLNRGNYYRLDSARQAQMSDTIGRQIIAAQDRQLREEEKAANEAEKARIREFKGKYNTLHKELILGINQGGLESLAHLQDNYPDLMTGEDQDRLLRLIQKPPLEQVSDPTTIRMLDSRVYVARPTITERELQTYMDMRSITAADYERLAQRLTETTRTLTNDQKTVTRERHEQAEKELRAALNIPTLTDKLDPSRWKAYSLALQELATQSTYFDGPKDPIAAVRENIIPRYQKMLTDDARLEEEDLLKILRYPDMDTLKANANTMSKAEYQFQLRLMNELNTLRATQARTQPAPAKKP